ncbi:MAG TPA: hypothetical protein VFG83_06135, partial [Kofleriaceae bacterium]|nr:hypothetical protein [Kofleriaceae bacterium]
MSPGSVMRADAVMERPGSRLGFTFHLAPGGGRLTLKPRRCAGGWLTVEALELAVPNLTLPVDLSAGADKFQRRRTEATRLCLTMAPGDLDELALARESALAALGVTAARLRFRKEHATVWAQIRGPQEAGEVCFKVYPLAHGGGLRLVVADARCLGALATPAVVIAHRILCALTAAVAADADPVVVLAQGLGDVLIDAAAGVLWQLLPPAGWRLPETATLAAELFAVTDDGARVVFGNRPGPRDELPPGGRGRELAAILAALASADGCLVKGDHEGALGAYREVMKAGGKAAAVATFRAIDVARALAVGEKSLGATELATELCRDAMELFVGAAAPRAALAGLAFARRDIAATGALLAEVAAIDAAAHDIDAALVTALFAARTCAGADPDAAEALFEHALNLEPGCVEATSALAERYHDTGRWADLARILRARAAAAPTPDARACEHIRLAEILADRLGDPAAARAELSNAQKACPDSPTTLN